MPRAMPLRLRLHTSILDREMPLHNTHAVKEASEAVQSGLEEEIGYLLTKNRLSLSVAESCTGGLISWKITNVPGSSSYFKGSIVAYSNDVKIKCLSVDGSIIKRYGAVSDPVAHMMAQNVRERLGSCVGLSITGIAGPGGGTEEKPVGTIFIGVADSEKHDSIKIQLKGSRKDIRENSSNAALSFLRLFLTNKTA